MECKCKSKAIGCKRSCKFVKENKLQRKTLPIVNERAFLCSMFPGSVTGSHIFHFSIKAMS